MKLSGFIPGEVLDFYAPFSFGPDLKIVNNADKHKVLFYHYCYVLKAFYWSEQYDKAKGLLKYLRGKYPAEWLKDEKGIPQMAMKLMLPGIILRGLKKIKHLK